MPSFNSDRGVWTPANERTITKNGEVYEGPDRAATEMLKDNGDDMGIDAKRDPENIMRAQQMHMTVDEFLKLHDPIVVEKQAENEKKKKEAVVTHKSPEKKRGVDTGNGSFGEPVG